MFLLSSFGSGFTSAGPHVANVSFKSVFSLFWNHMSQSMRKSMWCHMRTNKVQISSLVSVFVVVISNLVLFLILNFWVSIYSLFKYSIKISLGCVGRCRRPRWQVLSRRLILLMLENGKLQYSQRSPVMRKPVIQPGFTQTVLYNQTRWLEAWKFGFK